MRLLAALIVSLSAVACSSNDADADKQDAASADACAPFTASPASPSAPVVTRAEVDDIIKNACAFSSCHGGSPGAGGLSLPAPPANWVVNVVNKPSQIHKTMKLVVPGDPTNSFFVQKLTSGLCALSKDCVGSNCGSLMPQGSVPLSSADLAKVVAWVRQGASDK